MKKLFILILAIGFLASCQKTSNYSTTDEMIEAVKPGIKTVTVEELKERIDTFAVFNLIDVRDAREHNHGYIPGSVNISRGTLEFNIGSEEFWESTGFYYPEKTEEFVLYCKKGNRSVLAAESLKKLGYKNVFIIEGGFKKWELTYPNMQDKNLELESHGAEGEVGGC